MTRYLVTDQQLRHAIHSAISALDISKHVTSQAPFRPAKAVDA